MDGGSADHAGAVIFRLAGDHPLFEFAGANRKGGDRPQCGLLQRPYQASRETSRVAVPAIQGD